MQKLYSSIVQKPCTKQAWYWLAEGKQTLLANNKPAWYKISTLNEQSFYMSKKASLQTTRVATRKQLVRSSLYINIRIYNINIGYIISGYIHIYISISGLIANCQSCYSSATRPEIVKNHSPSSVPVAGGRMRKGRGGRACPHTPHSSHTASAEPVAESSTRDRGRLWRACRALPISARMMSRLCRWNRSSFPYAPAYTKKMQKKKKNVEIYLHINNIEIFVQFNIANGFQNYYLDIDAF